jgi:hypothetical protein
MTPSIFKPAVIKSLMLGIIFLSAFQLQSKAGGIVFEIYLNNNLLLKQQYNKIISGSPAPKLTSTSYNDNLRILFSSCGESSVTRSVGVRNDKNELVKKWDFVNSSTSDLSMTIPVKEILDLQKGKSISALKLFYYSPDQFKDGYMLASVLPANKSVAFESKIQGKYIPAFAAGVFVLGTLGWMVKRNA